MVSPDGVTPSRIVGVSASVSLPLHHKVQKCSGCSRKKGRKMVAVVVVCLTLINKIGNCNIYSIQKKSNESNTLFNVQFPGQQTVTLLLECTQK